MMNLIENRDDTRVEKTSLTRMRPPEVRTDPRSTTKNSSFVIFSVDNILVLITERFQIKQSESW